MKDKIIEALNNIDEEELFDLCKQITEKHLDETDELYEFFHRQKKYFDLKDDVDEKTHTQEKQRTSTETLDNKK